MEDSIWSDWVVKVERFDGERATDHILVLTADCCMCDFPETMDLSKFM
jgi:hypothetical protein